METYDLVRSAVFTNQSPAAADYFQERLKSCFSSDPNQSHLIALAGPSSRPEDVPDSVISNGIPSKATYATKSSIVENIEGPARISTILRSAEELKELLQISAEGPVYIYITQRNSISRLNVTYALFQDLLLQIGAFPQLYDFISCFGLRNGERELRPQPMRFRWLEKDAVTSEPSFECAYIIRFVELNNRNENNPWSIRQSLVYHQSHPGTKYPRWLFIAASNTIREQVDQFAKLQQEAGGSDPFALHLLIAHIAVATWRRYLIYLAEQVQNQGDRAILAEVDGEGAHLARLEEGQYLKQLEDMITDLTSALDGLLDVCNSLSRSYTKFRAASKARSESMAQSNSPELDLISEGLQEKITDLKHYLFQAQSLRTKVKSASELIANVLQLDNGNALKVLAIESRSENAIMHSLTEKATRDAAAVKVLTIITLVYLPATAVLNFFSTSFIENTVSQDGSSVIKVTSDWWISLAVSLPLTIITLAIWRLYVQIVIYGHHPAWWASMSDYLKSVRRPRRADGQGSLSSQGELHSL